MKYVDAAAVRQAFIDHLVKYCDYTREDAEEMASYGVPSRYENCWLTEEYRGEVEIAGEEYIKYASYTLFFLVEIYGVPSFRYYTYYRASDIEDRRRSEQYDAAKKLYQLDDLDLEEFPGDVE